MVHWMEVAKGQIAEAVALLQLAWRQAKSARKWNPLVIGLQATFEEAEMHRSNMDIFERTRGQTVSTGRLFL